MQLQCPIYDPLLLQPDQPSYALPVSNIAALIQCTH